MLLALARNEAALGFWSDLGLTSMFLLWIALCGAGLLCLLRNYLSRQSVAVSAAMVLAMTVTLVMVVSAVAYYFGSGLLLADSCTGLSSRAMPASPSWSRRWRCATSIVTHEWRHNVELQAKARVHALQARIRPHFLFNSMNTIAALTRSNPGARRGSRAGSGGAVPRQPQ